MNSVIYNEKLIHIINPNYDDFSDDKYNVNTLEYNIDNEYKLNESEYNIDDLFVLSLEINHSDEIYVCFGYGYGNYIFKINSKGERKNLYDGSIRVENDYADIIWNKTLGLIILQHKGNVIIDHMDNINPYKNYKSPHIDENGNPYQIINNSLWDCNNKKYLINYNHIIHEFYGDPYLKNLIFDTTPSIKFNPNCNKKFIGTISDIKFHNNNIYSITKGGFLFFNNKLVTRLWTNICNPEIFVIKDNSCIINDEKHLIHFDGIFIKNKILLPKNHEKLIISHNGDIIFTRRNKIYKITNPFIDKIPTLQRKCIEYIHNNKIDISILSSDLKDIINNIFL